MRTSLLLAFLFLIHFSIKAQVQASFSYPSGCLPNTTVQFTNSSTGAFTYLWDFGDPASGVANTSTTANPSHTYPSEGTYTVSLHVVGNGGATSDTTIAMTIKLMPQASFTVSNGGTQCFGNGFQFSNTSTNTSGSTTYLWRFGDGNSFIIQNPYHVYSAAGVYAVQLVVQSNAGCKDSVTHSVIVNPQPIASFTLNTSVQCLPNNAFQFINSSTITSGSMTYKWTFGDGGSSTAQNPNHIYTQAGSYTVKLVAQSNSGCVHSSIQTVIVNPNPQASFNINNVQQCLYGNFFSFTNTSSVSSGSISSQWSFGDGTSSIANNPTHAYTAAGTYTVKLVVQSSAGCADSATKLIIVYPNPNASFTVNNATQCLSANNFSFTNTSTISSGVMTYTWKFGDNTTSNAANPSHTYTTAGTYRAQLNVYSGYGCFDSSYRMITVLAASFATDDKTVCQSNLPYSWNGNLYYAAGTYTDTLVSAAGCDSIVTLNLSVISTTTSTTNKNACFYQLPYLWNGYSYNAPGTYSVTLTNSRGCDSIATLNLSITSAPVASFTYALVDTMCGIKKVVFNNTSSNGTSYYWDFADGSQSTTINPVHYYVVSAGAYNVSLAATNSCGSDTIRHLIVLPSVSTMASVPSTLVANRECNDGNWTNYYFDNNTPADNDDDSLLLSLKTNGNNIGTIGDGTFEVKLIATQGAGSNTGILLTNPLISNPSGFWVMNRYWNVTPTNQPTSPVGVRFYYNQQDINDVNGSYPAHNLVDTNLIFYKTTGGNPDPTTNLAGATAITSIMYSGYGTIPDTTHWIKAYAPGLRPWMDSVHAAEFAVSHFSGGGGGATGNGQILPLKLVSFDAYKNGKTNVVKWITSNESKVDRFIIERSADGIRFNMTGNKEADNSRENVYTYIDNNPANAVNYYRLKMIDTDGSVSYSTVRMVNNKTGVEIVLYPNPVKDLLNLKLRSESRREVQLQIISVEGKVLNTVHASSITGTSILTLNVSNLKQGSYLVRVISNEGFSVLKFEKM